MIDEALRRRDMFQEGMSIPLADCQAWVFPLADGALRIVSDAGREEYFAILRAYEEAEDAAELRLAELALAIFLIELNYELDQRELESLFSFAPSSRELAEAQGAFQSLAFEHFKTFREVSPGIGPDQGLVPPITTTRGRFFGWLKSLLPVLRLSFDIPDGKTHL